MSSILKILNIQWGWVTPGTGNRNKSEQWNEHLRFLKQNNHPATKKLLVTHCGWWVDCDASNAVRRITGDNPEPDRSLTPLDKPSLNDLKKHIDNGCVEYIIYPYAACVAEATTGEGLLRSFRLSRDIALKNFENSPRVLMNHDAVYGLGWGTVQMPQIANIIGISISIGMNDETVEAPDGTRMRMLGRNPWREIEHFGKGLWEIIAYAKELAPSIKLFDNLDKWKFANPAVCDIELEAIAIDEYLKEVPAASICDSRTIGTKNWYGGTIDSLLQEQYAKSVEVRLPALEALAVLSGNHNSKIQEQITDLWKKSFILMDNHTLWQCHNYKAHYLPESQYLYDEMVALEKHLLGSESTTNEENIATFNPSPWKRNLIVEHGRNQYEFKNMPGWSSSSIKSSIKPTKKSDDDPYSLVNDQVAYKLNDSGEVIAFTDNDGRVEFDGLGRLTRIHETPDESTISLDTGDFLRDFSGSAALTTEIDLDDFLVDEVDFEVLDIVGDAFLMEVERIGLDGESIGIEQIKSHSLHWGGMGLPKRSMNISPRKLNAYGAKTLKITLWMLAEGSLKVGNARCWIDMDNHYFNVKSWMARIHYRTTFSHPENIKAEVLESNELIKKVRFTGTMPDLNYSLIISLAKYNRFITYSLKLDFPEPTPIGLTSPPFSKEDGSLLGAQCERPYIPGLAVLAPLPKNARYYSDKPYFIQEAFNKSKRTWHADKEDWWLGISPFIGMNMAAADYGDGQIGMFTHGLKHFFRWKRENREMLGLSLGASLIHQMTQGHSVPKNSRHYDLLKRMDHNPYFETPFLHAHGEYTFHYAFQPEQSGDDARVELWKNSREFAMPPLSIKVGPENATSNGIESSSPQIIITAMEKERNEISLRLLNMSSKTCETVISLPFKPISAKSAHDDLKVRIDESRLITTLAPNALREIKLKI